LFFSCDSSQQNDKVQKTDKIEIQAENINEAENLPEEEPIEQTDVFCDTTKFPDYKENLALISEELNDTKYQDKKAKEFIDKECNKDSLFCGEINKKMSKSFKFNAEWTLDLVGYVLDQGSGMEENSASFFIMTINRNGQIWFSDVLSDLMGEITVILNGFEDKDRQIRVWGHVYPYFDPDYGKFELTIKNGTGFYEYECHAEH